MIYFIINPAAGSGRAAAAVPVIENIMRNSGAAYSLIYTETPGNYAYVSKLIDLSAAQAVVCVGGDGTLQEYAGLAVGQDINFGVIPAGSGNDLLLSMPAQNQKLKFSGFENKIRFYTEKIIRGETAQVDAISINAQYFFNIGGTGIDIQVLQDALPLKKFIGKSAYFISLIKNTVTYNAAPMTLTVDGRAETAKFLLLAVCNGSYYGGGMRVAPPAVINDGLITLCKVKNMPRLKLMSVFPRVKKGSHGVLREVSFENCSSVKIEFSGKKIINLDGNLLEFKSPLDFKIIKNAVRFII